MCDMLEINAELETYCLIHATMKSLENLPYILPIKKTCSEAGLKISISVFRTILRI